MEPNDGERATIMAGPDCLGRLFKWAGVTGAFLASVRELWGDDAHAPLALRDVAGVDRAAWDASVARLELLGVKMPDRDA